jgi:hypothetical protein
MFLTIYEAIAIKFNKIKQSLHVSYLDSRLSVVLSEVVATVFVELVDQTNGCENDQNNEEESDTTSNTALSCSAAY